MEFRVESEPIETTSLSPTYRPDPNWVHVDSEGHEHRWVDGDLPTLTRLRTEGFGPDGDEYSDVWYECQRCFEEVEPGYKVVPGTGSGFRTFMPGPPRYYVDDREVSREEFDAIRSEAT